MLLKIMWEIPVFIFEKIILSCISFRNDAEFNIFLYIKGQFSPMGQREGHRGGQREGQRGEAEGGTEGGDRDAF